MEVEVTFKPMGKKITVRTGTTILDAARKCGVLIATRCGGKAACLMCKVELSQGEESSVSLANDAEKRKLGSLLDRGIRLSCQARVQNTMTVMIPEDPLKAAVRKQLEAARNKDHDDELW
ncbi:2Fe-2S iron-sulfur cluster-binding protein [Paenibacillus sp. DS2015]|uniref:2Fe-2S iron-sulfur cluster-binding protein n=1 Tax=Paenibacillus sp. DS2015 TaxID=3373917 RepID=UPI003D1AB679